ncbi:DNA mismatch repair protein MutS [Mucilaginibacter mali]|uniref:DNA mismatch repair protein MutS n=1 Tax=Mucilaginibacter mali TaxID=2740462 RepID=A0A7D4TYQ9_9SPHI|nr:DNA mismatch repair protein MutS [Mucilaginibacter mali]QKJ31557.1 DNA mismatch repair protein MutS [Mucilaginibacter mali]
MNDKVITGYQLRVEEAQQQIDKYSKLINTYSFMRLGIFALLAAAIWLSVKAVGFGLLVALFIILLFAFAWLVSRQSFFEEQRQYFINLKKVNENEIASMTTRGNIYDDGSRFTDDKHPYTSDLDIFGRASLYQLANRAATYPGREILANWLSSPSQKQTILNRQEAVKELAAKPTWKLDLQARLLFANSANAGQLDALFHYLKLPLHLPGESWLRPYIKIAPYLLLAAIIGGQFFPIVNLLAILVAIFNMGILVSKGSYMAKSGFVADKIGEVLNHYANVFKRVEAEQWQSAGCKALAKQLLAGGTSKKIAQLSRLINKLSYSLIMIVGFILNVFFLWALKQIIAIEDWKRENKDGIGEAFQIIGEMEALLSLSGLHHNYPEWTFPAIADGNGYTIKAKTLAHPLINNAIRVANDFELEDAFKIDIITGSNMAGKSTFLRTVGINAVLGLCGAPVCADSMELSVIRIVTYMRIKDSLNESTSTFKAELDRLQMLLAAVEQEEKVYFLIDEMLRGTNSVDKYLGSKAVIKQLILKNGVGQVATHDLQIARLEDEYPDYVRNYYFDIQVVDGEMLFDYKIKHGECKTFNASLLLQRIGIDVEAS